MLLDPGFSSVRVVVVVVEVAGDPQACVRERDGVETKWRQER